MRAYVALTVLFVAVYMVWGDENEAKKDMTEQVKQALSECNKKYNVTESELNEAKTKEIDMSKKRNQCYSTCVLKAMHMVKNNGQMDTALSYMVIDEMAKHMNINDTQPARNAVKDCAEKMKGLKEVNCEVGKCVGENMKDDWHHYISTM